MSLADPIYRDSSTTRSLTALIDVSASIPAAGRAAFIETLKPFLNTDDTTKITVYPFSDRSASEPISIKSNNDLSILKQYLEKQTKKLDTGDSDIASAIASASTSGDSSSVLLFSDGFETKGDAQLAARSARDSGIQLFPIVPDDTPFHNHTLNISSLYVPLTVASGDRAPIRVSIANPQNTEQEGTVQVWSENKKLISLTVRVPPGEERLVTANAPTKKGGLHRVRAVLYKQKPNSSTTPLQERHTWVSVKEREKILLLNGKSNDQRILGKLLSLTGYALDNIIADGNKKIPTTFKGYSTIILNNIRKQQLPNSFLPNLKSFVAKGGGLILIGGNRSYGLGGYIKTPLEEISPVSFVPPQTTKRRLNTGVVLVLDKSGSMTAQGKILAAKKAAFATIKALKDDDYVSVIGFDATPFVVIRLKKVKEVKSIAERRLKNLTAAGGTNLLPALAAARQSLRNAKVSRKHLIVMSDGKFPLAGNAYVQEIERLRKDGITISSVALGSQADVTFMKLLAKYGKGTYYHTLDPSRLPEIFIRDIKVTTGEKTMKENQEFVIGSGPSGLRSTGISRYPILTGFVETRAKDRAKLELITRKDGKNYPILASWNYKKGSVIAFTSDANGRWSYPWLRWKKFPTFWREIITSVKNKNSENTSQLDFDLRYSVSGKTLSLDLSIFDSSLATQAAPPISAKVIEPGGEIQQVSFMPTAKGRFEATLNNARPGDYKVNIQYGNTDLPPLALTLSGEIFGERSGRGLNVQMLTDMAFTTGGLVNPDPSQVSGASRVSETKKDLFPPLALLAFILILIEAFFREGTLAMLYSRILRISSSRTKQTNKQQTRKRSVGVYT